MARMTHCERILRYMRTFGSITSLEAFTDLGVARLSARIKDLRTSGHRIDGKTVAVKNRHGETCHVTRYTLIEEKEKDDGSDVLENLCGHGGDPQPVL